MCADGINLHVSCTSISRIPDLFTHGMPAFRAIYSPTSSSARRQCEPERSYCVSRPRRKKAPARQCSRENRPKVDARACTRISQSPRRAFLPASLSDAAALGAGESFFPPRGHGVLVHTKLPPRDGRAGVLGLCIHE